MKRMIVLLLLVTAIALSGCTAAIPAETEAVQSYSGEQNASAIWNPKEPRMQKRVLIRHRHETDCAKAGTVEKQTEIVN